MTSLAGSHPLGAAAAVALADASEDAKDYLAENFAQVIGGIDWNGGPKFPDDVFVPNTATITINSRDQNFPGDDGERHTFTKPSWLFWNDHDSAYRVHFDWQVWSGENTPFWQ